MTKKRTNHHLQLDYDMPEEFFIEKLKRIKAIFHILSWLRVKDIIIRQTKKGFHVYLDITSEAILMPVDCCLLQSLLGSDHNRETFNYHRIKSGVAYWNVLYNQKWHYDEEGNQVIDSQETNRPDLQKMFLEELTNTKEAKP